MIGGILPSSPLFWQTFAGVVGPVLIFVAWLLTKRHKETNEDRDSISSAITAITGANMSITTIVSTLMEPMQKELDRLSEVESRQTEALAEALRQHEEFRTQLVGLRMQLTSVVNYVRVLRRQVIESGAEPAPLPPELENLQFD
jgi:hypothetical protein